MTGEVPVPESALDHWLATRPESVQRLAREFPLGTVIEHEGERLHLLGWTEGDMLIVSPHDPATSYSQAMSTRVYLCAAHVRR